MRSTPRPRACSQICVSASLSTPSAVNASGGGGGGTGGSGPGGTGGSGPGGTGGSGSGASGVGRGQMPRLRANAIVNTTDCSSITISANGSPGPSSKSPRR